MAGVKHKYTS